MRCFQKLPRKVLGLGWNGPFISLIFRKMINLNLPLKIVNFVKIQLKNFVAHCLSWLLNRLFGQIKKLINFLEPNVIQNWSQKIMKISDKKKISEK